jgi:DNA-binding NtrC family response regulator
MSSANTRHPILIVDDEPEMLFSLKSLLRHEFDVHLARGGAEALEILKTTPIHLIMTDQRMPEMSGVEVLKHVKVEYPAAIRVIFTGYADTAALVEAINHGNVYRFITKPWDPDDLVASLREACTGYGRIVQRRHLVRELRTYADHCQILTEGLQAGTHGTLTDAGRAEVERLTGKGREILTALDHVLDDERPDTPIV